MSFMSDNIIEIKKLYTKYIVILNINGVVQFCCVCIFKYIYLHVDR